MGNSKTGESWIGAGGVNVRSISYTYDAVGNMITANDPDAKYIYGYDALNRLATLDNSGTIGVPAVSFTYSYDEVGRMVAVADKINGTSTSQTDYTYDLLNRAIRITQSGAGVQSKRVDMTYNQVNQMTGLSRFSDLGGQSLVAETSYTYDQNQRLIQLAHKKGISNLASYDYTFDAANKLTKIVSSIDGTIDYAYDATNQLTEADHSRQTDEAYKYDANGNRTNAGYQTGTNNQLQADGQFTYEYDGEGNRTKRTEIATGKVTEYVWDYHNRLTGVLFKSAAGVVEKNVEYVYDTNNLRIGKKIDGVVTERFAIDRDQIALVFDGSGVQKSRYLYGTQIDQVLAEESGAQVHWFLTDHQGTVKDVVDNVGTVIDHITYDSFGRIVGQTSPIELRFAYTGREWDGETRQYYYRARYYDAAVGRFISEDPIGFIAGDGNINRYVNNSPLNYIDPSGQAPQQADPNGEECRKLNEKIANIIKKIAARKKELNDDYLKLPETCPPGGTDKDSRQGHRDLIRREEENLEKKIKRYLDRCGGGNPPALIPVPTPRPNPVPTPSRDYSKDPQQIPEPSSEGGSWWPFPFFPNPFGIPDRQF